MNENTSNGPIVEPGRLLDFGWNASIGARYAASAGDHHAPARIIRTDRSACRIATPDGLARCRLGAASHAPVTGDWVVVSLAADGVHTLVEILPRSTAVVRANSAATGEQALAANVDVMFLLHGLDRPHRVGRLERLAILSWQAGVRPVIVLTKTDLAGSESAAIEVEDATNEIRKVIHAVEVVATSARTGAGMDGLRPFLRRGSTIALTGESGAGKSSLINRLVGDEVQATGRTRRGDHKGRHTTTSRELVPIPGGAVLMDTPGLRSISMPDAQAGLARSYADLEAYTSRCRFRDCAHRTEPGCEIQAAISDGRVPVERWAGYLKLQREMAYEARRAAQRSRRAEAKALRRRKRQEPDEW